MLKANLKIIFALKEFLFTVADNKEYKSFFRNKETDFTRKRKLSFEKLALLIVRLCKKTLSVEIEKFFEEMQTGISCSVAAFSLQRMKLNPSFFYSWNMVLWMNFYTAYGSKVKRWRGFRVIGCDGSTISLVNRPELQQYFGGQSNQSCSFVVAKTFYCYDVLNKMILFPQIAPYRYGELRMAYDILERSSIEEDMLLIFDRNFSNYKMAALLQWKEKEIKYVIRVKDSLNFFKKFIGSKKSSAVIEIFPSPSSIDGLKECGYIVQKNTPLKVRLVRVKLSSGKIEVLMTNLWQEEGYADGEFKTLYAMRWRVESNISFQKNILQLESLSGLTPISVMQDFYATVVVTNLHFLLIKQAQETIEDTMADKKYPLQVNNNKAFGKIKENLIPLFISKKPSEILKTLHSYFIRTPLPIRKDRSYPRIRKNPMSKSKHKTFTNYKPAY
jgi:Transposase DDE domain